MRLMDVLAVLPALYVVVVLRAALPLVLDASAIAALIAAILAAIGAPWIARGVRAIVSAERASGLRRSGACARCVADRAFFFVHSAAGHARFHRSAGDAAVAGLRAVGSDAVVRGLGLPDTVPSWGTSLREAADVTAIAAFPWILSPASRAVPRHASGQSRARRRGGRPTLSISS